jgi:hypothetical protein
MTAQNTKIHGIGKHPTNRGVFLNESKRPNASGAPLSLYETTVCTWIYTHTMHTPYTTTLAALRTVSVRVNYSITPCDIIYVCVKCCSCHQGALPA